MKVWLEMEIGITGGVEDGVDNSGVDNSKLYTSPEQVFAVHKALSPIGPYCSIAAAFGNVHGVYKPGNVKLSPELLKGHQSYTKKEAGTTKDLPLYLVFHGGSGSTDAEIKEVCFKGVVSFATVRFVFCSRCFAVCRFAVDMSPLFVLVSSGRVLVLQCFCFFSRLLTTELSR